MKINDDVNINEPKVLKANWANDINNDYNKWFIPSKMDLWAVKIFDKLPTRSCRHERHLWGDFLFFIFSCIFKRTPGQLLELKLSITLADEIRKEIDEQIINSILEIKNEKDY